MNKKCDLESFDSNSAFIAGELFLENKCNSRCLYIELYGISHTIRVCNYFSNNGNFL